MYFDEISFDDIYDLLSKSDPLFVEELNLEFSETRERTVSYDYNEFGVPVSLMEILSLAVFIQNRRK